MGKENNAEMARYMANILLKMSGADVVAPAELNIMEKQGPISSNE